MGSNSSKSKSKKIPVNQRSTLELCKKFLYWLIAADGSSNHLPQYYPKNYTKWKLEYRGIRSQKIMDYDGQDREARKYIRECKTTQGLEKFCCGNFRFLFAYEDRSEDYVIEFQKSMIYPTSKFEICSFTKTVTELRCRSNMLLNHPNLRHVRLLFL
jgi:hypothetical protein